MTVGDCTFNNNQGNLGGGAITNEAGGTLSIGGGTFSDNAGAGTGHWRAAPSTILPRRSQPQVSYSSVIMVVRAAAPSKTLPAWQRSTTAP